MTVWVTNDPQYVYQHAVGFSGVIFTLALIESYRSTQPTRSVFGMVQVPTRLYPWVLLVVLSVSVESLWLGSATCDVRLKLLLALFASLDLVAPFFILRLSIPSRKRCQFQHVQEPLVL